MLPTEMVRARARDEIHLRRAPAADGRDPVAGPSPVISWVGRTLSPIGREQFLLTVPCLCRTFDCGADAELTETLRHRWLRAPVGSWTVTFVVAAFDRAPRAFDRLLLAVTATPLGDSDLPLDGPHMGRDLEVTLDHHHRARRSSEREPVRVLRSRGVDHGPTG